MMTEQALRMYFQMAGVDHGYGQVDARYSPFKEFKVQWQRGKGRADFQVSDYLDGAEDDVVRDFAYALMDRVTSGGGSDPYPPRLRQWMASPSFVHRNQSTYVRRSRNIRRTPEGERLDLREAYDRLEGMGLVKKDLEAYLTWTSQPNIRRVGYCSVLMKVIAISSALDQDDVPRFVSDYVLYHELLHLSSGMDPQAMRHGPEFRRMERMHPDWRDAEDWLRRIASRRM